MNRQQWESKYVDVLPIHDLKYDNIAEEMNVKVNVEYW